MFLIDGFACQASWSGTGKVRVSRGDGVLTLGGPSPEKELTSLAQVFLWAKHTLGLGSRGKWGSGARTK